MLCHRDIAELDTLLQGTAHDEIVVEDGKQRIVLRRMPDGWVQETTIFAEPLLLSGAPAEATSSAAPVQCEPDDGRIAIRAPLPGIFYRAPKPGAAPFVETGARVSTDTVIGIIETMKLMNSVAAGFDGRVAEICVANGTQVEAQDILMRVEP